MNLRFESILTRIVLDEQQTEARLGFAGVESHTIVANLDDNGFPDRPDKYLDQLAAGVQNRIV
ncbi:MAG: hypothetical protein GY953_52675, partial [bacterium]|nr:hypothetical protein [bacterium]